jgi:DNA polymerase III alpha subunit
MMETQTFDDVFDDPQVRHNAMAVPVAHPQLGAIELVNQPVRLSRTPHEIRSATPDCGGQTEDILREIGLDPADRRLVQTMELIDEIQGFPRHLSQHVGGFIITEGRLDELVPIENATMEDRTVICWDKDDIDALGILKVDILALHEMK